MPEGDTILWAATRMRPVLVGAVPDRIVTPHPRFGADRWPERLAGRRIERIDTHGKHLFIVFSGGLEVYSHLRMTGAWDVRASGGASRRGDHRVWLVIGAGGREVVQFDGPVLELMSSARRRFDQRFARLGPDLLAEPFDREAFLRRWRSVDRARAIGEVLLDQRVVAGIGNIWRAEACWRAGIDPWRSIETLDDERAVAVVEGVRPLMLRSGLGGHTAVKLQIYDRAGRPCPRCSTLIRARGQGDQNRTAYWCPGCQR